MAKRTLSVSKQASDFLTLVTEVGSIKGQQPSRFISTLSRDCFDVVFDLIPAGKLFENPAYEGVDDDFLGYSRYSFTHGTVRGTYASSPEHVIILTLQINGSVPAELTGESLRQEQVA